MNGKDVKNILNMSQTFASGKRLLLLFFLKNEPMGYTSIVKSFKNAGIPIGSSEVYKHLNLLLKQGFIVKNTKFYVLTLRGLKAVENTLNIINTPATIPKLELSFNA